MNQDDVFCGSCGSELSVLELTVLEPTKTNSCPSCMETIPNDQTHCLNCGSSRNLYKAKEPKVVTAGSPRRSRLPGIIFLSVGFVVIIFAFINFQVTGNSLRTDNNPGVGLQHFISFPIGIVGIIILIAGLVFLRESTDES